jgi:hypothetical protein
MEAPPQGITNTLTAGAPPGMTMPGQATFYFYNPNTVALGIADFARKWGNRKLEDHWRRSNKALTVQEEVEVTGDTVKGESKKKVDPLTTREYYLKDLPLTDSAIGMSNTKIINAYYYKGILYKEELNNVPKSVAAFEELNRRFPGNKYELNTYYMQYRIYQAARDQANADKYRDKILKEYPESEFAMLIKNPEYAENMNAEKSEVEKYYGGVYEAYKASNYSESYAKAKHGLQQFGKSDYADKFEFIKAMSIGKLKGIDTLEQQLKMMVVKYPNSEVTPLANDVLASIKNQKSPVKLKENTPSQMPNDTFSVNFDAEHYIFAIVPDNKKFVDAFTTSVNNFNTLFYTSKKISLTANLFGKDKQIILFKSFPNGKDALSYYENLMADKDVFTGEVKKDMIEIYTILPANIAFLYQRKSAESYKLFYADQFKKLKASN